MKVKSLILVFMVVAFIINGCYRSASYGQDILKLEKEISLPGVKGRIDHLDIDVSNQMVYVAALGNNTVEVIDLKKQKVVHTTLDWMNRRVLPI